MKKMMSLALGLSLFTGSALFAASRPAPGRERGRNEARNDKRRDDHRGDRRGHDERRDRHDDRRR